MFVSTHHIPLRDSVMMPFRHCLYIFIFLWIATLHCLVAVVAHGIDDTHASIQLSVVDSKDQPIENANAKVLLWIGTWDPTDQVGITNSEGQCEISSVPSNQYLTLAISAPGFASTCSDTELQPGESRKIRIQLHRPVDAAIAIKSEDGQPVSGAMLSLLSYTAEGGGGMATRYGYPTPFGDELPVSDANGILTLSGMPEGAKITVNVLHPDWVQSKVSNLVAKDGEIGAVYLKKGRRLTLYLRTEEDGISLPAKPSFTTIIQPMEADSKDVPYVYHRFAPSNNQIQLTVKDTDYDSIHVRSDDKEFFVTPYMDAGDSRFSNLLKLHSNDTNAIDLLVRRTRSIKGRITGDLSLLNGQTSVRGETENLAPTQVNTQEGTIRYEFFGCSDSEIQPDGTYELRVPPGRTRIEISAPNAEANPRTIEVLVPAKGEVTLPDIELQPKRTLRGRVLDPEGNPATNAVVRYYHGFWGSDYHRTDSDGEFAITPEVMHWPGDEPSSHMAMRIVAFDPASDLAASVILPADGFPRDQSLELSLEPRSSNWILDEISDQIATASKTDRYDLQGSWAKKLPAIREAYSEGAPGNEPPDLSEGTWLHSESHSLKAFNGKLVLLDFWFIGCGPCEYDLPTVKLAHELFAGADFEVIGVHCTNQSVDNVEQYINNHGVRYPTVVDNVDGSIQRACRPIGVVGFPSYILLGRNGRILWNDYLSADPGLRGFKVERIYCELRRLRDSK